LPAPPRRRRWLARIMRRMATGSAEVKRLSCLSCGQRYPRSSQDDTQTIILGAGIKQNDLVVVELESKEVIVRKFVVAQNDGRLYLSDDNGQTSEEIGQVLGLILRYEVVVAEPR
jgi:hypothetical protein